MKKAITPKKMTAPVALAGKGKSTSGHAQRRRIIDHLAAHAGGLNTFYFHAMGIMRPSSRISELKDLGYTFLTIYERAQDHVGCWHEGVARYFLTSYPVKEAA